MNETDAQFLGVSHMTDLHLVPIDPDAAFVGLVNASKDLHQRRFPGAIFADQCDHLAGRDREVDFTKRNDARKTLADSFELEDGFRHNAMSNAGWCLPRLVPAKFLQVRPKLIDIAFVDRAGRNNYLLVFGDLGVFSAQLLGEEQGGLMTEFVRILDDR
jgi:hypothetical protein